MEKLTMAELAKILLALERGGFRIEDYGIILENYNEANYEKVRKALTDRIEQIKESLDTLPLPTTLPRLDL